MKLELGKNNLVMKNEMRTHPLNRKQQIQREVMNTINRLDYDQLLQVKKLYSKFDITNYPDFKFGNFDWTVCGYTVRVRQLLNKTELEQVIDCEKQLKILNHLCKNDRCVVLKISSYSDDNDYSDDTLVEQSIMIVYKVDNDEWKINCHSPLPTTVHCSTDDSDVKIWDEDINDKILKHIKRNDV